MDRNWSLMFGVFGMAFGGCRVGQLGPFSELGSAEEAGAEIIGGRPTGHRSCVMTQRNPEQSRRIRRVVPSDQSVE